jgi:hypothetical protein
VHVGVGFFHRVMRYDVMGHDVGYMDETGASLAYNLDVQ